MAIGTSYRTGGVPSGAANDYTSFFKNRYPQRKLENIVKYGKPTFESMKKAEELHGDVTYVPIMYDVGQGLSASLTHALGNVSSAVGTAWQLTVQQGYAGITIDAITMLKSKNNEGAFFRAREKEFENMLDALGQRFEQMLWGDGTGTIGLVSAVSTTATNTNTVVTLTDANDVVNFHKGMQLVSYADSSGALGAITTTLSATVLGVDEANAQITIGPMGVAWAATDHIVREGDNNGFLKGIPAWIPSSAPSATTFFGVDRSNFPERLGGHRQTWLGSIEETVKRLDAKIRKINQKPKTLWLSFNNFNRLDLELGARGIRTEDGKGGVFGRPSLMMATPGGTVSVRCSPYVPDSGGWLLDMDTFTLCHLGGLPHLVQDDGLSAVRIGGGVAANALDGIEIRLRYFCQLLCTNPYANGYIGIS